MTLAMVVGVGIVVFALLFLGFKLDEEHSFLKSLMIIFGLSMLLIIPATQFSTCEVVLNDTHEIYMYGNYFGGYHWDGYNLTAPSQLDREAFLFHKNITNTYVDYCYDVGGSKAFIKAFKLVYIVFIAYLIVYLFVKSSYMMALVNDRRRKR